MKTRNENKTNIHSLEQAQYIINEGIISLDMTKCMFYYVKCMLIFQINPVMQSFDLVRLLIAWNKFELPLKHLHL